MTPAPHPALPLPHAGSLTDVAGLSVGHHGAVHRPTGCTVVLCEPAAVCGVDVRGAAPGTRETDLLAPGHSVECVDAIVLAGGSAFGLDAAGGVMRWLETHGRGFAVGPVRVPIVPAAVIFDLWLGDASNRAVRPDAAAGHAACEAAGTGPVVQGSVGAGAGATVGKLWGIGAAMKGGVGSASVTVGGVCVAALVVVNAFGDVRDPATGRLLAGSRDGDRLRDAMAALLRGEQPPAPVAGANTTIGVVATDARLDRPQCTRMATMAHDGLARSIVPVHTPSDGDALFALATGRATATLPMTVLGALAAEVTARAVVNAVTAATGLPGVPAAREVLSA